MKVVWCIQPLLFAKLGLLLISSVKELILNLGDKIFWTQGKAWEHHEACSSHFNIIFEIKLFSNIRTKY